MGNQIPVHAQTSGGISSIYRDDNDLILQNDVIATIESVDVKNFLAKIIREIQPR